MKTRRDFFRQAAAFTMSAKTVGALLASIERAAAIDPPDGSTFLDAEHLVILMQENRSFDHAFGSLRGVRGFNDPRAVTLPNQNPVWLQTNAAGETFAPFRLDLKNTRSTWLGSLPHSWRDQTDARSHGNHDGWLDAKISSRNECAAMPLTMGYYNREDLPFYYALADAFTICDQNFCSSLTATTPNRLYLWTGTIRARPEASSTPNVRNSDVDYSATVNWKTFPERLEEAGVSWRIYQNELSVPSGLEGEFDAWLANFTDNALEWFDQYQVGLHKTHREFLEQMAATLPAEVEKLRVSSGSQKELAMKEKLLDYVTKERARLKSLAPSDRERILHEKAFTTNEGDPDYRQLAALRYRDHGIEREMLVPKGDPLHRFRRDVETGNLPVVSWLIPSERFSDHPSSPWYGAWYLAEALNVLTKNPAVWSKTIFILTYDENDGYFDHVPPFVAPDPANPESGKVSSGIDFPLEYLPLDQDRRRYSEKEARGGPIGLGFRVPMIVASPWSRGGFVCSQVFDHTSVVRLVERVATHRSGKEIRETNISAWRRTICGDLTSSFRPFENNPAQLPFPPRDSFFEQVHRAQFTPMPSGFAKNLPKDAQEPGVRPSTALPYELAVHGAINSDGTKFELALEAGNKIFGAAAAGAPFHVYARRKYRNNPKLRTRAYAIAAGDRLTDSWDLAGFENRTYHLCVCGPNGFLREFSGDARDPHIEIRCDYVMPSGDIKLRLTSRSARDCAIRIKDQGYKMRDHSLTITASETRTVSLGLARSHRWYDFTVTVAVADAFLRRFAGRVETGENGLSDPLMGGVTL